jgi:LacI family transcriptional regulator
MRHFKIPVHKKFFITGESTKHAGYTEEAGVEAIFQYDRMGEFPDALFCSNDTQAIGAYHALNKLGMKIPDDIAIMGYDNIKFTRYLDLTTIDQKMYTVGVKAIRRLADLIRHSQEGKIQEIIDPILVPRESTKKPKS